MSPKSQPKSVPQFDINQLVEGGGQPPPKKGRHKPAAKPPVAALAKSMPKGMY